MNIPQRSAPKVVNSDSGHFHLTANGWIRTDNEPFPKDRVETWKYEMECPALDAKEQVRLTRIWISPDITETQSAALHEHNGEAVPPAHDRHITLDCWA